MPKRPLISASAGRTTRNWERIKANQRAKRLPCFHCGQPIDYSLTHPDPQSFSADHLKPKRLYPELAEDPGNIVSSHLLCNQVKGDRTDRTPALGALSETF